MTKTLYTCGELRKMNGVRVRIEWGHMDNPSYTRLCVVENSVEDSEGYYIVKYIENDNDYPSGVTSIQVIEETHTGDWQKEFDKFEDDREFHLHNVDKKDYLDFIQQQINKAEAKGYENGYSDGHAEGWNSGIKSPITL